MGQACEADYVRQHQSDDGKPEYGWLESGLFSGGNEKALPAEAVIERTLPVVDGFFIVYVKLTYRETFQTYGRAPDPANKFSWPLTVMVVSEDGKYVVDDILLPNDDSSYQGRYFATIFRTCDGTRWKGYE